MPRSSRLAPWRLIVIAAVLGPFFWMFGPALLGGQSFAFRDAAHYYYPLFEWTAKEWSAGRIPLWNPLDNCGSPAVADATSSVFYPGKLLFALPLPYALQYKLYVSLHVLLAALTAYGLARHWKTSQLAAGVCAVSYALGGNVLFQYCNVVFLVGAAWLPLALLATDRALRQRQAFWAILLGAILALMVLGGAPQTAYHAGLLAALYALILWRQQRREGDSAKADSSSSASKPQAPALCQRLLTHPLALLTLAAGVGATLAAVQIIPSTQWTRHSVRASYSAPRNLVELATSGTNRQSAWEGLLGEPRQNTHHEHIYHFSVEPWRLPELIWPNCSGRLFPTHRRWTAIIPAHDRVWTPSLYMGLLPLLLALGSWRLRGGQSHQRWLSWAALTAAIASLGWFGAGWIINELRCALQGADPDKLWLGNPVGGLYWLMVVLLPGYVYFRYPAKLLVVAALAMSLLAALGWDRMLQEKPILLRKAVAWLGVISAVAAIVSLLIRPFWSGWLSSVKPDDYFGPLQTQGAANDLLGGTLHAALLCGLLWWLLGRFGRAGSQRWAAVALLVTAVELTVAHGWMIATAPDHQLRQAPAVTQIFAVDREQRQGDIREYRVYRASRRLWRPKDWLTSSSPRRQLEGLQWDRETLLPKYHLSSGEAQVASSGTLMSADYQALLLVARQYGPRRADQVAEPHSAVLDALAARRLILPADFAYPHAQLLANEAICPALQNAALWRSDSALPRAWIVRKIETLPRLSDSDPTSLQKRTQEVYFPEGQPRNLREEAVIETDAPFPPPLPFGQPSASDTAESCRIVVDQPNRVEISVQLTNPGLVVLSDLNYPGWKAWVVSEGETLVRRIPVWRTNRTMRGVYLPAGGHRVVYRYQPGRFYFGLALSGVGWLALGLLTIIRSRRVSDRNRAKSGNSPPL